jgi:hypothetical protein
MPYNGTSRTPSPTPPNPTIKYPIVGGGVPDAPRHFIDVSTNFVDVSKNFVDVSTNFIDMPRNFIGMPRNAFLSPAKAQGRMSYISITLSLTI